MFTFRLYKDTIELFLIFILLLNNKQVAQTELYGLTPDRLAGGEKKLYRQNRTDSE